LDIDGHTLDFLANCENVIAVGATQQNKNRPNFSNYGIKLDVSAPGVNIYSTYPNNTYKILNGTSMAAPHVTGVASLMLAQNPDLTPAQVEQLIKKSVNNFPGNSNCTSDKNNTNASKKYCGTGIIDAYQAVVNSQITLLPLNNSNPVKKSEHGQTLYKFKYLDTDEYSGVKEFSVNFSRIAGTTHLYIKKNGLPDANDSNSYDCNATYNGSSENNNEASIYACLKDIKLAYGDLLYIQTKVSGVSNDNKTGSISVSKTHPPVWSGDLDVGQSRTHSIKSVHKKKDGFLYNDLELKMTLTEVSGTVIIKITKVTNNDTEQTIISTQQTCTADENSSCSIYVTLKYNEIVYFEVENTGSTQASYKIALDAITNATQLGQVEVAKGVNNSTDWWSYTHQNLSTVNDDDINASNGPRIVQVTLTGVDKGVLDADLDLYTKLYATNDDIIANDITTASGSFDCRPYLGGSSIETCKTQYDKDSGNNIDEKVRIRVRGYYDSSNQDKTVKFKLITKTSRHVAY
jgi:hypothetical protein